jgi:transposase-like protein
MNTNTCKSEKSTVEFNISDIYAEATVIGLYAALLHVVTILVNLLLIYSRDKFLEQRAHILVPNTTLKRYVGNGFCKERTYNFFFGISIKITIPRVKDRCPNLDDHEEFTCDFIEKYKGSSTYVSNLSLLLYIKGISQSAIHDLYCYLFNNIVKGFSQSNISRMKDCWIHEYEKLKQVNLQGLFNHTLFIDAVYLKAKGSGTICVLVVLSLCDNEYKILAWHPCMSEYEEQWCHVFNQLLKNQHMGQPNIVVSDGGTGGLAAVKKIFPQAYIQKCWVHKARNVFSLLPRKAYKVAANLLKNIYNSPDYDTALENVEIFKSEMKKYKEAVDCVIRDLDYLLTMFKINGIDKTKIYTTNPIECVFSAERMRLNKTRGMLNYRTIAFTSFKFIEHIFNTNRVNDNENSEGNEVSECNKGSEVSENNEGSEVSENNGGDEDVESNESNKVSEGDEGNKNTTIIQGYEHIITPNKDAYINLRWASKKDLEEIHSKRYDSNEQFDTIIQVAESVRSTEYVYSYQYTVQNTCISINTRYRIRVFVSIHNTEYVYSYQYTIQNTCIRINTRYRIRVFVSIHNTEYVYSYQYTVQNTCIRINTQYMENSRRGLQCFMIRIILL